jgi:hypothetical protein
MIDGLTVLTDAVKSLPTYSLSICAIVWLWPGAIWMFVFVVNCGLQR